MPKRIYPAALLLACACTFPVSTQAGDYGGVVQRDGAFQRDGASHKAHCHGCRCATCRPLPHGPHHWLGPLPPVAPLLNTAALLRTPAPGRTTLSFRQESGTEPKTQESGDEKKKDNNGTQESTSETPSQKTPSQKSGGGGSDFQAEQINKRLDNLESDVRRLYDSVLKLVEKLDR